MSSYYTTNSTYGAFYKDKIGKIEENVISHEQRLEKLAQKNEYNLEKNNDFGDTINKQIKSQKERLEKLKELDEKGIPMANYIIPS